MGSKLEKPCISTFHDENAQPDIDELVGLTLNIVEDILLLV